MSTDFNSVINLEKEEVLFKQIEDNKSEAEDLLKDKKKLEHFLERLEKKLSKIPLAGKYLADVPVLISLVKAYADKEYTEVPIGTIIAIISALIYVLSPIDIIPDILPAIGISDDAAVVAFALKFVHDDVEEYRIWREANKKVEE
ncbi:MAG: YkvA family protein [Lachnospiraceae bacterium]|nr:YkvA family protein [Lachnospiraceae bacterium]